LISPGPVFTGYYKTMDLLIDSFFSALLLIKSLDPELWFIVFVSLKVSLLSTVFSGVIGIPIGFWVSLRDFTGKQFLVTVFNTLLAVPTVVIGLFVYAFISRRGVFGPLDLLYTQNAIVIGQVLLVIPIIITFTIAAVSRVDDRYRKTAMTLGATPWQTALAVFREARFGVMAAVVAAFGRVIAEVGVSMMLGGNIKGFTRTMTTAMALEYDKGEFILAVALGLILLAVSFTVNVALSRFQGRVRV
jgi:tungstate transport system permease protein